MMPMPLEVQGELSVPGDKSLSHRALMLAAAGVGESRLRGLLPGEDCRSTASVLRALGCQIPELPSDGAEIRIRSNGLAAWTEPEEVLDCGNSGTTARLMMGLLAGRPFRASLTGDESLRGRPMRRVTEPLTRMGASVRELERPDRLPLEITGGSLQALDYASPKASAQIKSAILFAGLSAGVPVAVTEPALSRDHSERMLRALGAVVRGAAAPGGAGWRVEMDAPGALPPLEMAVPGDPSSAAFLVALALLADRGELRIRNVGLNPTRTAFFDAARRMGGAVEFQDVGESGGEPVGSVVARASSLRATHVEGAEVPALIDEIPILATLAARAEGETVIRGADELRAKESDRIEAMVANLRAVGVQAEELPDGLVVRGGDQPLRGRVRAFHDHRIAMSFAVLGALPGCDIQIDHPEVVSVSYPGFWEVLRTVTGSTSPAGQETL